MSSGGAAAAPPASVDDWKKMCLYDVLGVERKADDSTIKKAFHKRALKHHPDKNVGNQEEATEIFKVIQEAYTVLSDRTERSWYDGHRDEILRQKRNEGHAENDEGSHEAFVSGLYRYFSSSCWTGFNDGKKGFYGVYRSVFDSIAKQEAEFGQDVEEGHAPSFGGIDTEWDEVRTQNESFLLLPCWSLTSANRCFIFAPGQGVLYVLVRLSEQAALLVV